MATVSGPGFVTDGLKVCMDTSNSKSIGPSKKRNVITDSDYSPSTDGDWLEPVGTGGVNLNFTFFGVYKRVASHTGYATAPFLKYAGTTTATSRLYHFGTNSGSSPSSDGKFGYYYTHDSGSDTPVWGVNTTYVAAVGEIFEFSLQYDNITGGQIWLNGEKYGISGKAGGVYKNAADLEIYISDTETSPSCCKFTALYDRTLTDAEMRQNYHAIKRRYDLP